MANSTIPYQDPTSTNRSLASQTVTRAGGVSGVAHREETITSDPSDENGLAKVVNSTPDPDMYGSVVRPIPRMADDAVRTQVPDTTVEAVILAANPVRIGVTIYNDSSAVLYVGLGSSPASSTNFTAKIFPNGYYRVPSEFIGAIRGVWASDPNDGGAKITEW